MSREQPEETREQRLKRQADESHSELGKFVVAFEEMVAVTRDSCLLILSARAPRWQRLINIVLHHQVMTAKPLMDIMRALFGTILGDEETRKLMKLDGQDIETFNGVLAEINKEYDELTRIRNDLIHGTWYIGYARENQTDFSQFLVAKFKTSKSGLQSVDDLPTTADMLRELSARCCVMSDWIRRVHYCWAFNSTGAQIRNNFKFNDLSKKWERT